MSSAVTADYLMGIREGRDWLKRHGAEDAVAILDNLNRTCRMFDAQGAVGQMLRGERDFWRNQIKRQSDYQRALIVEARHKQGEY